jgi:hypothetical protein
MRASSVFPAVVAAVVSVVASFAFTRHEPRPPPQATTELPTDPAPIEVVAPSAAALSPAAFPPPTPGTPAPPPPADRSASVDRAAAHTRARAEFDADLFAHAKSPIDPRWARDAEERFARRFAADVDGGGPSIDVGCRSSSCLATITYEGRGEATRLFRNAARLPTGMNCAIQGQLGDTTDEDAPVVGRVLYFGCQSD